MLKRSKYQTKVGLFFFHRVLKPLGILAPIVRQATGLNTLAEGIQPGDVILAGFPKSGTTWMQILLAAVIFDLDIRRVPLNLIPMLVPGTGQGYFYRSRDPMYFKTHTLPGKNFRRVIYMVRDGRDVMVSYHHHLQVVLGREIPMMDVVRGRARIERFKFNWPRHVERYLENPHQAEILWLRYEDLLADTLGELQRVCAFLPESFEGISLEDKIAQTSLSVLKEKEMREGNLIRGWESEQPFFRRGTSGGYREAMTPEVQAAFLETAGPTLEKLGYPLEG